MHFGVNMVPVKLEQLTEAAQLAENLGFESLWVGEHVLTPVAIEPNYPGGSGEPPFRPDSRFTEPLVTLAHLGAVTTRVRLGTGILILPLHPPLAIARAIATVDALSGGRLSLGLGVGWMKEEFDAVGQNFRTRGRRIDEMIDLLDRLFTESRPSFDGEFYQLPEMGFEPKPVQQPRPPFLIGGSSDVALRRAARLGEGWYGGQEPPEQAAVVIDTLRGYREEYGRSDLPFEITLLTPWGKQFDAALVAAYEELGVDRIVVTPWKSSRDAVPAIQAFAEAAGLPSGADR